MTCDGTQITTTGAIMVSHGSQVPNVPRGGANGSYLAPDAGVGSEVDPTCLRAVESVEGIGDSAGRTANPATGVALAL
ncbi:hypothetical protein GCM10010464_00180 [Pseudonocardia yunnanensis]